MDITNVLSLLKGCVMHVFACLYHCEQLIIVLIFKLNFKRYIVKNSTPYYEDKSFISENIG